MSDTKGAQRVDYGNKTGEAGHGKEISSKPAEMIKAGPKDGNNSGPTGSERNYPKDGGQGGMGNDKFSPDFNPMKDKKRGATEWAVGGV